MWPDRVLNPGPLTYESGALPIVLRGPAMIIGNHDYELTDSSGLGCVLSGKSVWFRGKPPCLSDILS